jgi:Na+/proline symporter
VGGLLNGTIAGAFFGIIAGVLSGITVLAFKHPKVYKKLYGVLLVILLGALAGGAISDLSNGSGYSRFIVTAVILYVSFLRALPLLSGEDKPAKEEDDK